MLNKRIANTLHRPRFHKLAEGNLELSGYLIPKQFTIVADLLAVFPYMSVLKGELKRGGLLTGLSLGEGNVLEGEAVKINEFYKKNNGKKSIRSEKILMAIRKANKRFGENIGELIRLLKLGKSNNLVGLGGWSKKEKEKLRSLDVVILNGGLMQGDLGQDVVKNVNNYLEEMGIAVKTELSLFGRKAGLRGSIGFLPVELYKKIIKNRQAYIAVDLGKTSFKTAVVTIKNTTDKSPVLRNFSVVRRDYQKIPNPIEHIVFEKEHKGMYLKKMLKRMFSLIYRCSFFVKYPKPLFKIIEIMLRAVYALSISADRLYAGRDELFQNIANEIFKQMLYLYNKRQSFSGVVTFGISAKLNENGRAIAGGSYPKFTKNDYSFKDEINKKLDGIIRREGKEKLFVGKYDPSLLEYILFNDGIAAGVAELSPMLQGQNVGVLTIGGVAGFSYFVSEERG